MKKKIGLVLSGGGVKGAVHAGMIHYFDEIGFKPDSIAGTSTGAIVGSLYAAGKTGKEILDFFMTERPYSRKLWSGNKGLINTAGLADTIAKHVKVETFEELKIPLITAASNMFTGKSAYFSKGPLVRCVLASASFPGVFSPMEIDGVLYSDGGLLNHFPADVLRPQVDFLIGMHLSPIKQYTMDDLKSTKDVLARTVDIQGAEWEFEKLDLCDIAMCPSELTHYGTFDFSTDKMQEMFGLGFNYIQKHEKELITLMKNNNDPAK
tara:strand:+ start:13656 stop:14450 length:795 start_codon:yes stop_codon:yes gene_type:complete